MQRPIMAGFLALLFCLAPLSGCFGENVDSTISEGDVTVTPKVWTGGEFQAITIAAESDVSVFVPYLMLNPENGFVQNSTVVDIKAGKSVQLTVLAPPRTDTAVVLIGEYGREDWPIRDLTESWRVWYARDGFNRDDNQGVSRVSSNTSLDAVLPSTNNGGEVIAIRLGIERPFAAAYSEPEGGRHSMGLVDGRTVLNYINVMSDETPDPLDLADGAVGYLDRWAGQGNAAYEDGAQYLIKELEGFGLEVINQRFVYDSVNTGQQNPEAYNICGYRFGEVDPDKWMVFGAHFDIAPPVNGGMISPHLIGERTYGTRVGAYDNTAGTSMVLTVAEAMAGYSTRNTMVFCLWSGEEGGKRGSDYWTEEFAEAWTAMTLMNGDYVHWIDGACRFNPARIIQTFPHTLPDSEQLLHGLFVGRGFTVHQFSHLVQRLQGEIKITKAKLIVVDGPITMHLDPQIGNYEARSLFRKTIDLLKQIADENDVSIVLITSSKAHSRRHSHLLTMVKNRCQASLLGKRRRIQSQNKMWLFHMPTRSSGYRKEITPQQTLHESISRVIDTRIRIEGAEEIE